MLPRPQPTTSPGRRPRLDRSSKRALGAPPAAGAAPTLLQLSTADVVVKAPRPCRSLLVCCRWPEHAPCV